MLDCSCDKGIAKARYLGRKRDKDNEALFEKRIKEFDEKNPAIVKIFTKAGSKVVKVRPLMWQSLIIANGFQVDLSGTRDESFEVVVKAVQSCAEWTEAFQDG